MLWEAPTLQSVSEVGKNGGHCLWNQSPSPICTDRGFWGLAWLQDGEAVLSWLVE